MDVVVVFPCLWFVLFGFVFVLFGWVCWFFSCVYLRWLFTFGGVTQLVVELYFLIEPRFKWLLAKWSSRVGRVLFIIENGPDFHFDSQVLLQFQSNFSSVLSLLGSFSSFLLMVIEFGTNCDFRYWFLVNFGRILVIIFRHIAIEFSNEVPIEFWCPIPAVLKSIIRPFRPWPGAAIWLVEFAAGTAVEFR